ncbi:MAG: 50S ribosomal protein L24 [Thiomonas sp.]|uniref:50S ribosomal protein L24 n=1 Tax=Thiomonas sp. TaxID=2047785 RepID=UPI002A36DEAE|nr:50S ribosomal protein L24 [Thiomonas sp.]MDY0329391.1 50S ribosomal protein L24 [Thiomonas sp.]
MNKIRKDDEVIVIAGSDKGRRGRVTARVGADHVVVEGVHTVRKNVRPNPMKGEAGGVVSRDLAIHQSNVAIYNPVTGKADRIGFRILDGGAKVRIFKSSGEQIKG